MILLIISQVIQMNPFTIQRDVNRLRVEIYDEQFTQCQECINDLMNDIRQVLSNNLLKISYADIKKTIYIKLKSYTTDDSLSVVKVLEEKGVRDYVVGH